MFKLLGKKSIKLLEYFRMTKCMKEILIISESVIYLWNSPWIPYLQTVLWFWTYTWPKAFVMLFSWPLSYFHYTSYSWWIPSTPHTYGLCSLSLSVLPAPGPLHLQSGLLAFRLVFSPPVFFPVPKPYPSCTASQWLKSRTVSLLYLTMSAGLLFHTGWSPICHAQHHLPHSVTSAIVPLLLVALNFSSVA